MKIEFDTPKDLEEQIKVLILTATKEAFEHFKQQIRAKEYMTLKEGAVYAGVSYNTFMKFRTLGLKVCEIEGIKRVSKTEIDRFLQSNSF